MSIAAVPGYLGKDFREASPGMRFGMYLAAWESANWAKTKEQPLAGAKRLTDNDRKTMQALCGRQKLLFEAMPPAEGLRLDAKATAPFTTGLGNEHPLENGFAFLNPYGLPYLPGSGVKGVLRQAARELASGDWSDTPGWSRDEEKPYSVSIQKRTVMLSMCDVLFGRETAAGDADHVRGVLSFWDVIPEIKGESLHVEIMTPHQGHYYQQKQDRKTGGSISPHESGQPIPITFLTVPPGSDFGFHVICDLPRLRRLAPELAQNDQWKTLLTAAFEHAFAWLGFGAKTAVGYGALQRDHEAERKRQQDAEEKERKAQEAAKRERERQTMSPLERSIHDFLDSRPDKNQGETSAVFGGLRDGHWQEDEKRAVAEWLKARLQESGKWREVSSKKNPAKDKEYQNTLKVKGWLEGKE